jgi:hypothetical protein
MFQRFFTRLIDSYMDQSTSLEDVPSEAPKEAPRHSPAKAARRMLTQALGFPVSIPSSRGPERKNSTNQSHSVGMEAGLRQSNAETDVASLATEISSNGLKSLEIDEGLRLRDAAVKDMHSSYCSVANHQYVLSPFATYPLSDAVSSHLCMIVVLVDYLG